MAVAGWPLTGWPLTRSPLTGWPALGRRVRPGPRRASDRAQGRRLSPSLRSLSAGRSGPPDQHHRGHDGNYQKGGRHFEGEQVAGENALTQFLHVGPGPAQAAGDLFGARWPSSARVPARAARSGLQPLRRRRPGSGRATFVVRGPLFGPHRAALSRTGKGSRWPRRTRLSARQRGNRRPG